MDRRRSTVRSQTAWHFARALQQNYSRRRTLKMPNAVTSSGIYAPDNSFASHDMLYGDIGSLVGWLGGTIHVTGENDGTEHKPPFSNHDSLRVMPSDPRVDMTILRQSTQCIALAYCDGRFLNKTDASASDNRATYRFTWTCSNWATGQYVSQRRPFSSFRNTIASPVQHGVKSPKNPTTRGNARVKNAMVVTPIATSQCFSIDPLFTIKHPKHLRVSACKEEPMWGMEHGSRRPKQARSASRRMLKRHKISPPSTIAAIHTINQLCSKLCPIWKVDALFVVCRFTIL